MEFNREWAMPNKNTFSILPIKKLIKRYIAGKKTPIDPFCNNSIFKDICVTNDLDPEVKADYNMDALDFFGLFASGYSDLILYDPPYSARQVSEVYKKMSMSVNMETTQASYWSNQKKEIARIMKKDGIVISFGWNSGGIGKVLGFEIIEILLVPHGGHHNDTIVTVERKVGKESIFYENL